MSFRRQLLPLLATLALSACFGGSKPTPPPITPPVAPTPVKLKIGLALGGGAAKGFAHIGGIKMLEASGIHPDVVAGTSAGSVVDCIEIARPAMMLVAWPVVEALAICWTGGYWVPV